MVSTKGRVTSTAARPTLHQTMTFLRSKRSAMTPDAAPRKKPGTMRADMTTPTAAADDPAPGRPAARAAMARKPSQSPIDEMTRSEKHTSELQSLMRNSYAVFCLKKKKQK